MSRFWCEFLSEKLQELETESEDELDASERAETQEARQLVERMTAYLVGRLAGLDDEMARKIDKLFSETKVSLDYHIEHFYVSNMLERIPKMVGRTMKLSPIMQKKTIPGGVDVYWREATRTYVYGFWDASVAMSRAAIESALRPALKERAGQSPDTLREVVAASLRWGILDKPSREMADKVVPAANRVLHRKPAGEAEAWDTLCASRGEVTHAQNKGFNGA